jgi:hypothetical protein
MSAAILASSHSPTPPLPAPRAFATLPADLDLDFNFDDRAALVTRVLALCCVGDALPSEIRETAAWNLPLSARIARLLRILELTTAEGNLTVHQTCADPACRQIFEFALPLEPLQRQAQESAAVDNVVRFPRENSAPFALRLPTGRDQASWRREHHENQAAALNAIVRSLAIEPPDLPALSPEQLQPIAAAMGAADPLVAFRVHTACPHCRRTGEFDVDLEGIALRELERFRRAVLVDVHVLASQYGWSEAEVLAIPPRRRADYRNLIAARERTLP